MNNVMASIMAIIISCLIAYCMYWVFKTLSYAFFYQDMVIETIKEIVKPEYLIK